MVLLRAFLASLAVGLALLASPGARAEVAEEEATAVRFWEYANCTLTRDKWRVEQMLSAPRNSDKRKEATSELATRSASCVSPAAAT